MFYFIIRWASIIFFKTRLSFNATGGRHIPSKGAFILAANHCSYLDPFLLTASTHRPLHFITRAKILTLPFLGWVFKHANTIPVKSRGRDLKAIKDSLKVLAKGKVLAIFPEGTRTKDRKLKEAKSGVGMIAYMAKVPVLPAYIDGTFDAMPRGFKTFKRHPVRIYIGKPVYFKKEYDEKQSRETYQRISDEIMRHIAELKAAHIGKEGECRSC